MLACNDNLARVWMDICTRILTEACETTSDCTLHCLLFGRILSLFRPKCGMRYAGGAVLQQIGGSLQHKYPFNFLG